MITQLTAATQTGTARTGMRRTPGGGAVLHAEWTKLWLVRSTWAAVVAATGVGVGVVGAAGGGRDQLPGGSSGRAGLSLRHGRLGGVRDEPGPGAVQRGSVAAIAGEYTSGMLGLTLTVTPRRGRVLAAKATLVAVVSFVLATASALGAFLTGEVIFAGHGAPTAALTDPGVARAILGWGADAAGFALIALAVAVLTRSAAAALTTTIGVIFAPMLLGGLLPDWVRHDVLAYLPGNAATQLATALAQPGGATYLVRK